MNASKIAYLLSILGLMAALVLLTIGKMGGGVAIGLVAFTLRSLICDLRCDSFSLSNFSGMLGVLAVVYLLLLGAAVLVFQQLRMNIFAMVILTFVPFLPAIISCEAEHFKKL